MEESTLDGIAIAREKRDSLIGTENHALLFVFGFVSDPELSMENGIGKVEWVGLSAVKFRSDGKKKKEKKERKKGRGEGENGSYGSPVLNRAGKRMHSFPPEREMDKTVVSGRDTKE